MAYFPLVDAHMDVMDGRMMVDVHVKWRDPKLRGPSPHLARVDDRLH